MLEDSTDEWTALRRQVAGLDQQFASLGQQVARLAGRVEDLASLMTDSYHHQMSMLRRIHNSGSIYLGGHVAMTFLTNGYRAFVDTRSLDVGVHLLHGGTWETHYTEAFKRMLRPGAVVVDVGANLGWYTLVAAPIVGGAGRVFAVEPNPGLARLVQESVHSNGFLGWTRVFQVALSDAPGVVDLIYDPDMPGGGVIRPASYALTHVRSSATRVAAVRLDALLAEHAGPVDVIKMDIEGWEGVALCGMTAILDRSPGLRILTEWGIAQDQTPVPRAQTASELGRRGYTPFRIEADGSIARETWDWALGERALTNLVLLPEGDPLAGP
jgi:FkbM family methyltransferase